MKEIHLERKKIGWKEGLKKRGRVEKERNWMMWRMCHNLSWINLNGKGREERKREKEIERKIEGEI